MRLADAAGAEKSEIDGHGFSPFLWRRLKSGKVDEDVAILDLCFVGLEIDADGCALGGPRAVIEAAIMLWTFDCVIHHEPVGEVNRFMGTKPVGREILIILAIDGEGLVAMVEADDVLVRNCVGFAGFDPLRHCGVLKA